MKDYRDGVIDLQEMAHSNYNLTTGSTRAHSVTGGRCLVYIMAGVNIRNAHDKDLSGA
jgi:hypothetical protein